VSATGAVSTSGTGAAVFQSVASNGESFFYILLDPIAGNGMWEVQIFNRNGRLSAGTYQILTVADLNSPSASFYYTNGSSRGAWKSTTGELVITESSLSSVRGTFHFTAASLFGPTTVSAEGAFNASCAPGMSCQ
jgi:hypothetical protein